MTLKHVEPELHYVHPTPHSPNSKLPIIVYRGALQDTSAESILSTIEPNAWLKGGQWKTYKIPHFHSNTHECYGIIKGSSTYLLGKSPIDPDTYENGEPIGFVLHVKVGDVFVLPAGITHRSLDSEGDYEFIGLYPGAATPEGNGEPRFDMHWGKESVGETKRLAQQVEAVSIPDRDPLYGLGGPLPQIWREVLSRQ
ncbi:putative cupin protein [Coleophoma crateriformis]|uniref:Putative cupin protein n=1 Tax=Coleophoma crateriformis TaxID=565419 RepID=A0A3D8SAZ1_9HELO|nr:putative cupin protein [Coleophoma crateriformis]